MAEPVEARRSSALDDVPTWRPTVSSYRNLAVFTAGLAMSAGVVLALTDSAVLVVATAVLVLVSGTLLTMSITPRRVRAALAQAQRPQLGNWPGSEEERRALRRRGWRRCGRSLALAVVAGAFGGFYPVIGVAFVGLGVAGTLGSTVVAVLVSRFEVAHDVTVLSPSRMGGGPRRRLIFGVVDGRF
jgi:hypothetical protein